MARPGRGPQPSLSHTDSNRNTTNIHSSTSPTNTSPSNNTNQDSDHLSPTNDLDHFSSHLTSRLEELNARPSPVITSFPPRPPRRSVGSMVNGVRQDTPTTSPMRTPPVRQRRRVSEGSAPRRVEPTRMRTRQSLVTMGEMLEGSLGTKVGRENMRSASDWVAPPGTTTVISNTGRQRKHSVFVDHLSVVQESVKEMNSLLNGEKDTEILTHLIQEATAARAKRRLGDISGSPEFDRDRRVSLGEEGEREGKLDLLRERHQG